MSSFKEQGKNQRKEKPKPLSLNDTKQVSKPVSNDPEGAVKLFRGTHWLGQRRHIKRKIKVGFEYEIEKAIPDVYDEKLRDKQKELAKQIYTFDSKYLNEPDMKQSAIKSYFQKFIWGRSFNNPDLEIKPPEVKKKPKKYRRKNKLYQYYKIFREYTYGLSINELAEDYRGRSFFNTIKNRRFREKYVKFPILHRMSELYRSAVTDRIWLSHMIRHWRKDLRVNFWETTKKVLFHKHLKMGLDRKLLHERKAKTPLLEKFKFSGSTIKRRQITKKVRRGLKRIRKFNKKENLIIIGKKRQKLKIADHVYSRFEEKTLKHGLYVDNFNSTFEFENNDDLTTKYHWWRYAGLAKMQFFDRNKYFKRPPIVKKSKYYKPVRRKMFTFRPQKNRFLFGSELKKIKENKNFIRILFLFKNRFAKLQYLLNKHIRTNQAISEKYENIKLKDIHPNHLEWQVQSFASKYVQRIIEKENSESESSNVIPWILRPALSLDIRQLGLTLPTMIFNWRLGTIKKALREQKNSHSQIQTFFSNIKSPFSPSRISDNYEEIKGPFFLYDQYLANLTNSFLLPSTIKIAHLYSYYRNNNKSNAYLNLLPSLNSKLWFSEGFFIFFFKKTISILKSLMWRKVSFILKSSSIYVRDTRIQFEFQGKQLLYNINSISWFNNNFYKQHITLRGALRQHYSQLNYAKLIGISYNKTLWLQMLLKSEISGLGSAFPIDLIKRGFQFMFSILPIGISFYPSLNFIRKLNLNNSLNNFIIKLNDFSLSNIWHRMSQMLVFSHFPTPKTFSASMYIYIAALRKPHTMSPFMPFWRPTKTDQEEVSWENNIPPDEETGWANEGDYRYYQGHWLYRYFYIRMYFQLLTKYWRYFFSNGEHLHLYRDLYYYCALPFIVLYQIIYFFAFTIYEVLRKMSTSPAYLIAFCRSYYPVVTFIINTIQMSLKTFYHIIPTGIAMWKYIYYIVIKEYLREFFTPIVFLVIPTVFFSILLNTIIPDNIIWMHWIHYMCRNIVFEWPFQWFSAIAVILLIYHFFAKYYNAYWWRDTFGLYYFPLYILVEYLLEKRYYSRIMFREHHYDLYARIRQFEFWEYYERLFWYKFPSAHYNYMELISSWGPDWDYSEYCIILLVLHYSLRGHPDYLEDTNDAVIHRREEPFLNSISKLFTNYLFLYPNERDTRIYSANFLNRILREYERIKYKDSYEAIFFYKKFIFQSFHGWILDKSLYNFNLMNFWKKSQIMPFSSNKFLVSQSLTEEFLNQNYTRTTLIRKHSFLQHNFPTMDFWESFALKEGKKYNTHYLHAENAEFNYRFFRIRAFMPKNTDLYSLDLPKFYWNNHLGWSIFDYKFFTYQGIAQQYSKINKTALQLNSKQFSELSNWTTFIYNQQTSQLRTNVTSFFDWLPIIYTLPFQFENTSLHFESIVKQVNEVDDMALIRNSQNSQELHYLFNMSDSIDYLEISLQKVEDRIIDTELNVRLNSDLKFVPEKHGEFANLRGIQYIEHWRTEAIKDIFSNFYNDLINTKKNKTRMVKLPVYDLDYNIYSLFWQNYRINYGADWPLEEYQNHGEYDEWIEINKRQYISFSYIEEGPMPSLFEFGSKLPMSGPLYDVISEDRYNEYGFAWENLREDYYLTVKRRLAYNYFINVQIDFEFDSPEVLESLWDGEDDYTHLEEITPYTTDYFLYDSADFLLGERFLASNKIGQLFYRIFPDWHEPNFRARRAKFYAKARRYDLGRHERSLKKDLRYTIIALDDNVTESEFIERLTRFYERRYIEVYNEKFYAFEDSQAKLWYKKEPLTAYFWPFRNYEYPFIFRISEWNYKKTDKYRKLYSTPHILTDYEHFYYENENYLGTLNHYADVLIWEYAEEEEAESIEEQDPIDFFMFDEMQLREGSDAFYSDNIHDEEWDETRNNTEEFIGENAEDQLWNINTEDEMHWDYTMDFSEYLRPRIEAEDERGLIADSFDNLDIKNIEYTLGLNHHDYIEVIRNFSDSRFSEFISDDDEFAFTHINYHIQKNDAIQEQKALNVFERYYKTPTSLGITPFDLSIERASSQPVATFIHYFLHSFVDDQTQEAEWPFVDIGGSTPYIERDWEYPDITEITMWLHLNEQRNTIVHFWKLLEQHALSIIPYNKYIYIKYDILSIFNGFSLLTTNVDKNSLKLFSNNTVYDFFSLFLGFFKAKTHSHVGRDLFNYQTFFKYSFPGKGITIQDFKERLDYKFFIAEDIEPDYLSWKKRILDQAKAVKPMKLKLDKKYLLEEEEWTLPLEGGQPLNRKPGIYNKLNRFNYASPLGEKRDEFIYADLPDHYLKFAKEPLFSRYEYRYVPLFMLILYYTRKFNISGNSLVTFNYYSFLRLQKLINKNKTHVFWRSHVDQTYYHHVPINR